MLPSCPRIETQMRTVLTNKSSKNQMYLLSVIILDYHRCNNSTTDDENLPLLKDFHFFLDRDL